MTIQSLALFSHIVGVVTLFVALAAEWLSLESVRRADTNAPSFSVSVLEFVPRVTGVAAALILASGIYLTVRFGLWSSSWIQVSLAAMVLMGVLGGVALRPIRQTIRHASSTAHGSLAVGLRQDASAPFVHASWCARVAVALAIVYLMIAKPPLVQSVALVGLSSGIGLAIGFPVRRSQPSVMSH